MFWQNLKTLDFTCVHMKDVTLTHRRLECYLKLCPNLTSLNIAQDNNQLTANSIVSIGSLCKDLEQITLRNIPIQKRSLAYLAKLCPNLNTFNMEVCTNSHDHEMVAFIKNTQKLEKIGLKYSTNLSGSWLKHIKSPLKSLSLEMYEFNPDCLWEGMKGVKDTLKTLSFVSCSTLRARDIQYITCMLPKLTSFSLVGVFTLLNYKSLVPITNLKNLVTLDLEQNMNVSDDFMRELVVSCPNLKQFKISGVENEEFGENGLSLIVNLPELTHLSLACLPKLSDQLLKSMAKRLKHLQHLELMACSSITDEGCVEILKNCHELETLDISGCENISNYTILTAVEIVSECHRKKLHIIAGATNVTAEDWFSDPDVCKLLNINLTSTVLAHCSPYYLNNFYDSDSIPSDDDSWEIDDPLADDDPSVDGSDDFEYNPYYCFPLDEVLDELD